MACFCGEDVCESEQMRVCRSMKMSLEGGLGRRKHSKERSAKDRSQSRFVNRTCPRFEVLQQVRRLVESTAAIVAWANDQRRLMPARHEMSVQMRARPEEQVALRAMVVVNGHMDLQQRFIREELALVQQES